MAGSKIVKMKLKENKWFRLPPLMAGSFQGLDRLEIPYNILILKDVSQREDNGDIELYCQAKDGPEEKDGKVSFMTEDRSKKEALYLWLKQSVGKDIETIYNEDFNFGDKSCPICGNFMIINMEPMVATLANPGSKFPIQSKYWRCSNEKCGYKEKV